MAVDLRNVCHTSAFMTMEFVWLVDPDYAALTRDSDVANRTITRGID